MTIIELKYDAFNLKTMLTKNSNESHLDCFGTGQGTILRKWINDFFPEMVKVYAIGPGAECKVQFYGTLSDYKDVQSAYNEFIKSVPDIKINLLPCIRYPQAVDEVRSLITKKIAGFKKCITAKREEIHKLSSGNSDSDNQEWTPKINQDKARFERLARDNLSEIEGVIEVMKEKIVPLSSNSLSQTKGHDKNWRSFYNSASNAINDLVLKIRSEISDKFTALVKNHSEAYQAVYQGQYQEYTALYKKASELPEVEYHFIPDFCKGIPFNKPWLEILRTDSIPDTTIFSETLQIKTINKAVLESQNELNIFFETASNNLRDKESEIRAYYETELQKLYALVQDNSEKIAVLEGETGKIESALQALNDLNAEIDTVLTGQVRVESD